MICNQFIRSEMFNGDYDTASNISKSISELLAGINKFYKTLTDEFKLPHSADM